MRRSKAATCRTDRSSEPSRRGFRPTRRSCRCHTSPSRSRRRSRRLGSTNRRSPISTRPTCGGAGAQCAGVRRIGWRRIPASLPRRSWPLRGSAASARCCSTAPCSALRRRRSRPTTAACSGPPCSRTTATASGACRRSYHQLIVPEAPLEDTGSGLAPTRDGWFVVNAKDALWRHRETRGERLPFEGAEDLFQHVGVSLYVLAPGEPMGMYHWEAGQEDFLVLAGEALLIVEGEERPLRRWDFVHCPPETKHIIVGAGPSPVSSSPSERRATSRTASGAVSTRYQDGWLP